MELFCWSLLGLFVIGLAYWLGYQVGHSNSSELKYQPFPWNQEK